MVRVKICGITNVEDALLACELGADAIGLNFYSKSPRCISPFTASKIIRNLPPFVSAVGVFVNWQAAAVTTLAKALGLAAAQLHGDEPPQPVRAHPVRAPALAPLLVAGPATAADRLAGRPADVQSQDGRPPPRAAEERNAQP